MRLMKVMNTQVCITDSVQHIRSSYCSPFYAIEADLITETKVDHGIEIDVYHVVGTEIVHTAPAACRTLCIM